MQNKFPQKNKNKEKYVAFFNKDFDTMFLTCAFATHWKRPVRSFPKKTGPHKVLEK